jgi:dihydrofolate reductase
MKTQYYTATSLDGFIADPQNSLDWLFQFGEPEATSYPDFIRDVGALAMGSTTYEWLLTHHIRLGSEDLQPWSYEQPAWVFTSRSLPAVPGADIRFVRGDVRPVHREMVEAAGGKNIWLVGGGELVGQFYDHGLLDEIIVSIASVTLGAGAPLLPRAITTPPLRLVSVKAYGVAFAELRYEVPRPGAEGPLQPERDTIRVWPVVCVPRAVSSS